MTAGERRIPQKRGHGDKIGQKQQEVIAALLASSSIVEAAKQCGLHESTIRRWLAQESFAGAYRGERDRLLEQTGNELRRHSLSSVRVLVEIMNTAGRSGPRVAAARSVLDFCFRAVEIERLARNPGSSCSIGREAWNITCLKIYSAA